MGDSSTLARRIGALRCEVRSYSVNPGIVVFSYLLASYRARKQFLQNWVNAAPSDCSALLCNLNDGACANSQARGAFLASRGKFAELDGGNGIVELVKGAFSINAPYARKVCVMGAKSQQLHAA